MKKTLTFALALLLSTWIIAQTKIPQLVSFSAIVRDANNQPLLNKPISIRLTFKEGGQNGNKVYCALHQSTTNQNGFMSIQLNRDVLGTGCNGSPSTAFENIKWENGGYWMEVEYQTTPSAAFISLGQLELASTFYAFASGTAERAKNIDINGANNGDVLSYNLSTGKWEPKAISGITGPQGPKGDKGDNGNGYQNGTTANQLSYWNGTTWVVLNPGTNGQSLTICDGSLTWTTGGICPGKINSINCGSSTNNGTLTSSVTVSGVSSTILYTGGDGGPYNAQNISSTGVIGLTASLSAGNFANGNGNLTLNISGTPSNSGTATFALDIGGQNCSVSIEVKNKNYNLSELITTMKIQLRDSTNHSDAGTFTFKDLDGAGGNPAAFGGTNQSDSVITIASNHVYKATILLLDESKTPADTISNEVLEEGADHLFFFNGSAPTGTPYSVYLSGSGTTIKYLDLDANSRGIGLQTLWTAPFMQTGKSALTIELKHQPGTKDGSYTNGETGIQVPFKLKVN